MQPGHSSPKPTACSVQKCQEQVVIHDVDRNCLLFIANLTAAGKRNAMAPGFGEQQMFHSLAAFLRQPRKVRSTFVKNALSTVLLLSTSPQLLTSGENQKWSYQLCDSMSQIV